MPKRSNSRHPSTSSGCLSTHRARAALGTAFVLEAFLGLVACQGAAPATECAVGSERCACTAGGACDAGLECRSGLCVTGGDVKASGEASGATSASATNGSAAGATPAASAATTTPTAEPAPSAPTPAPAPDTTVTNTKPSYLVWSKTGGEGCEATYRTRWVREGSNGDLEELAAVDKLVLASGSDAYELITHCEVKRREVDCAKEYGLDLDPNDPEPIAPAKDTLETGHVYLGLRSVSTGRVSNPITGSTYLAPKSPSTMAGIDGDMLLERYTHIPVGSAGATLFVEDRVFDLGDACGLVGNVHEDDATILVVSLGSSGKPVVPKPTVVPASLTKQASAAAEEACRSCVRAIAEEEGESCKGHPVEGVASVAPVFESGKLRARWTMLTEAPIGACREAGESMLLPLVDDTLPPEWNVPTTPAIVKKAMAALSPTALTKPKSPTPMGWTEVTQEASAAGHVAKALGK